MFVQTTFKMVGQLKKIPTLRCSLMNVKNCPVYLYFSLLLEIEEPVDDSPTLDSDRQTSQVSGVHSQLL